MELIFGLSLRQRCQLPEISNLETLSFALPTPLPPSPPTHKLTQLLNYYMGMAYDII